MTRFEALRTAYPTDPERGVHQFVTAAGELPVCVMDGLDPAAAPVAGPFDHEIDLPIRAAVLTRDGQLRWLVLEVSHLSIDREGGLILRRELARRLAREPDSDDAVGQPADRAIGEATPAGRGANEKAVDFVAGILNAHPVPLFTPVGPYDAPEPRWPRVRLTSPALGVAMGLLAKRYRISTSVAYLTAMAMIAGATSGRRHVVFCAASSNRWLPDTARYIGTLNQFALIVVDVWNADLETLLRRVQRASLDGFAHASYNIDDVVARGFSAGLRSVDCVYNSHRSATMLLPRQECTVAAMVGRRAETRVETLQPFATTTRRRSIHLALTGPADRPEVSLCLDRHVLPDVDAQGALRAFETVMIQAAADPASSGDALRAWWHALP